MTSNAEVYSTQMNSFSSFRHLLADGAGDGHTLLLGVSGTQRRSRLIRPWWIWSPSFWIRRVDPRPRAGMARNAQAGTAAGAPGTARARSTTTAPRAQLAAPSVFGAAGPDAARAGGGQAKGRPRARARSARGR